MADKTITDLDFAPGSVNDINTFFVVMQGGAAYKLTGAAFYTAMAAMYNAHGAIRSIEKTGTSGLVDTYTITFADNTTTTFTVTNGNGVTAITQYFARSTSGSTVPSSGWSTSRQTLTSTYKYLWSYFVFTKDSGTVETPKAVIGAYGDTGLQTYVHIRYASSCSGNPPLPASDSDMGTTGDNWMGVYSGTSATAPTTRASYTWFQIKGATGEPATLSSQTVSYQASTSGTIIPSGTWASSIPAVPAGQYLWTRTIFQFNTGEPVPVYTVSRQGIDGSGSPGTNTPLPDTEDGAIGGSDSFAREDHQHPISDVVKKLPTWRGKKALIIGDSWLSAYQGLTPWSNQFLGMTGIDADLAILSGGGFTVTATGSSHTGKTFITVLDEYQSNSYDLIIVQGGVNDIENSTANIATAIASFKTKCDQYFQNVPIFYFPTTPFYYLTGDKNTRAITLIHEGIRNGLFTCEKSARFSLSNGDYKGSSDIYHPSQEGMDFLGRCIASFITSGDFPCDYVQIAGVNLIPNYAFQNITNGVAYLRGHGEQVNITLACDGATTATGFVTVATGFPISAVNYQNGSAYLFTNSGMVVVPAYVNNDSIIIDNGVAINMNEIHIAVNITYKTSSL